MIGGVADSIDDSVLVVAAAAAIAVVVALDLELKKLIALGAVDAALLKDVSVNGDDLAAVWAFDVVILLVVVIAAIVAVAAVVEILIDIALKLVKILVNSVKLLGDEINAVLKVAYREGKVVENIHHSLYHLGLGLALVEVKTGSEQ